jgi:hypothetical protein
MKNIHVLPTDKPSRLYYSGNNADLILSKELISFKTFERSPQYFYITSNEEIKMDDWYLDDTNSVRQAITECESYWTHRKKYQKIILTTDQDLIKDGVQAIDDEFLEWFVKNPSCEEVEIINEQYTQNYHKDIWYNRHKIIIPKEVQCTCKEHDPYCCQIHGNCPTCVKKEEPKQEKLTYTESAKKEERISNCTMMKRKRETLEEDDQTLAEIKERMKTRELEKTAVEWLIDWMKANQYFIGNDLLEAVHTAKAMEYFQNKKMYERGAEDFVKKVNQLSKPSSNE